MRAPPTPPTVTMWGVTGKAAQLTRHLLIHSFIHLLGHSPIHQLATNTCPHQALFQVLGCCDIQTRKELPC